MKAKARCLIQIGATFACYFVGGMLQHTKVWWLGIFLAIAGADMHYAGFRTFKENQLWIRW